MYNQQFNFYYYYVYYYSMEAGGSENEVDKLCGSKTKKNSATLTVRTLRLRPFIVFHVVKDRQRMVEK